jgi:hypothetical protein
MIQRGDRARFAAKTLETLRSCRERRREHFKRDEPVEPVVARAVNLAHTARAERSDYLVRTESSSGPQTHARALAITGSRIVVKHPRFFDGSSGPA